MFIEKLKYEISHVPLASHMHILSHYQITHQSGTFVITDEPILMYHNHPKSIVYIKVRPCCCCWVTSVVSNSVKPHRRQPTMLPVPGILQARTLERIAISFSNAWKWKVKVKSLSHVQLLATPWTAAFQAPPSMGFSRQEYWSGVPLPSNPTQ